MHHRDWLTFGTMITLLLPLPGLCQTPKVLSPARAVHLSKESKGACAPIFSPDSRSVAGCVWDTVFVWDTATGKLRATLKPHGISINRISFGADRDTIITGSDTSRIKVWSVPDRAMRMELKGHALDSWVVGIASSRDGNLLASTDAQRSVRLWDINKGVELSSVEIKEGEWFEHVAFSPDGKTLALAGGSVVSPAWGEVRIVDVPMLRTRFTLSGLQNAVKSMAYSPDGKLLAASTHDETVTVWDLSTKKKVTEWSTGISAVYSTAFGPRGDMIVTSGMQPNPADFFTTLGEARFWKINDGNIETREHFAAIRAEGSIDYVALSPDGKLCATGGRFCDLAVWNLLDLRKSD